MSRQLGLDLNPISKIRLVVIGKTGVGKSKTGNTILNDYNAFEFGCPGSSITKECQLRDKKVFGRHISVVDTPGLFDSREKNTEILKKIETCVSLLTPGPHVFVLVLPIGRVTEQDLMTINLFEKHFGKKFFRHVVICFTRFDDWKRAKGVKLSGIRKNEREEFDINGFISSLPGELRSIVLNKCDNRTVAFDNTLEGPDTNPQVQKLLSVIDSVVHKNTLGFYSFQDLKSAETKHKLEEEKRYHRETLRKIEEVRVQQNEIDSKAAEIVRRKRQQDFCDNISENFMCARGKQQIKVDIFEPRFKTCQYSDRFGMFDFKDQRDRKNELRATARTGSLALRLAGMAFTGPVGWALLGASIGIDIASAFN